jgi:DNA polymerase V
VNNVVRENNVSTVHEPVQLDLFTDYAAEEQQKKEIAKRQKKERSIQEARLKIKRRFGKNAILKGINFEEGATARERNAQIGGHKA